MNGLRRGAHAVIERCAQRVLDRQRIHPARQENVQLGERKFTQRRFEDLTDIIFRQLQTVYADAARAVFLPDRSAQSFCAFRVWFGAVENNGERLSDLLQLADHALLRRDIVLTGNLADRAVAGDDQPDRRMLGDDLIGSLLRCFGQRYLLIEPRRCHHAFNTVFKLAGSALDHVADAVDQPDGKIGIFAEADRHRLFRNEFRLRGHNGASGAALRQLIAGTLLPVDIIYARNNERFHEALDEGGLARPNRTHHTKIYISVRAESDVLVNR